MHDLCLPSEIGRPLRLDQLDQFDMHMSHQANLLAILSRSSAALCIVSAFDHRLEFVSDGFRAIFGSGARIGCLFAELMEETKSHSILESFQQVLTTQQALSGREAFVSYAQGSPCESRYLDYQFDPFLEQDGRLAGILLLAIDVTDRVQARRAIEESKLSVETERANFRNLFKQTPEMICILRGPEHLFEFVNEAHIRALGFDATGLTVRKAQPESVEVHGLLDDVYRTGKTAELSELPVTVTDRLRYFNLTYAARRNAWGDIDGIMILGVEVTDQVIARERLVESEARLRRLAETLPQLVWTASPDGVVDYYNSRLVQYHPVVRNDLHGWNWEPLVHSEDLPHTQRTWKDCLQRGCDYECEHRLCMADGSYRWHLSRATPEISKNGTVLKWFGLATDIHDQKLAVEQVAAAKAALEEKTTLLETVLEHLPMSVVLAEAPSGRLLYANSQLKKVWRHGFIPASDVDGYREYIGFHPDGRRYEGKDWPLARAIIHGETVIDELSDVLLGDGQRGILRISAAPIRNHRGEVIGGVVLSEDVTERLQTEKISRENQERLALALEASHIGFFDWNIGDCRILMSEEMKADWGFTQNSQTRDEVFDRVHSEDRLRVAHAVKSSLENNQPFSAEFRIVQPTDGRTLWMDVRGRVQRSLDGSIQRLIGTCLNITERKAGEEALVRSQREAAFERHKLEQVFAEAPAAMALWLGQKLYFDKVNPQYQAIFEGRQLVGRALLDAVPELAGQGYDDLLRSVFNTGKSYNGKEALVKLRKAEGQLEDHYYDLSYVRIVDPDGKPFGVYTHAVDVTERVLARRRLEESEVQLRRAKDAAESASRMKSAFLANMSHEIRTPLGAILGFTELLKDSSIDLNEKSQYLEVISRNGQQLTAIIDDVLDLSKIEAGQLSLECLACSPHVIVEDVLSLFSIKAKEQRLSLWASYAPNLPKVIGTDSTRFRQILVNIIGNGIKFTPQGSVKVSVSYERRDKGAWLTIDVEDSGLGLTKEQEARLFQPFSQADESMTRKFGGTGLGLSLSKRLAEALGGTVRLLSSQPRKGSTFRIEIEDRLSLIESNQQGLQPHRMGASTSEDLSGMHVLLVEDAQDNQHFISRVLRKNRAEVTIASNGLEGLQKATEKRFDLILMDVQMPIMDGHTATLKLREQGNPVPIIALTAHAMREAQHRCLEVGCNDYLTKPVNIKLLIEKVAAYAPFART